MTETLSLWSPSELAGAVQGSLPGPDPAPVQAVSIDSRTLAPGDLFVALAGPQHDGHDHVAAALAKGAACAIVARIPPGLPAEAPLILVDDTLRALERLGDAARLRTGAKIVAVTGSVGKTGTKDMLVHALSGQGKTHGSVGSFNNHWGVPLSLARMPRDADYAVFELGMNHAGEITALTHQVRPDIAIITTIEAVHLEFFTGIDAIADAKAEIFQGMSGRGIAILNRDIALFDRLHDAASARGLHRIIGFGSAAEAETRLIDVTLAQDHSLIDAEIAGSRIQYRLGQPGRHLVLNSLAVLSAVSALGADLNAAAAALGDYAGLAGRGRFAKIAAGSGDALLIDDSYNASPASMRASFAVLAAQTPAPGGRRIAVLGDMRELGSDGPALHQALLEPLLAAKVDQVFACGPLMQHLYDHLPGPLQAGWRATAADLAPLVTGSLQAGDILLVKGSQGSRMADVIKPLLSTPPQQRLGSL